MKQHNLPGSASAKNNTAEIPRESGKAGNNLEEEEEGRRIFSRNPERNVAAAVVRFPLFAKQETTSEKEKREGEKNAEDYQALRTQLKKLDMKGK